MAVTLRETQIEDLNLEVLYTIATGLTYQSLVNLCSTNTDFRNICQDAVFWKILAKKKYGEDINIDHDNPLEARRKYLEVLTVHGDVGIGSEMFIDIRTAAREAGFSGERTVMDYYESKEYLLMVVEGAAAGNHLWYIEEKLEEIVSASRETIMKYASSQGHFDIVKYVFDKTPGLPVGESAIAAAMYDQLEIFSYLILQVPYDKLDAVIEKSFILAAEKNSINIAKKIMSDYGITPEMKIEAIYWAGYHNNEPQLAFIELEQDEVWYALDGAANSGNLDIVNHIVEILNLVQQDFVDTIEVAVQKHGNIEIVRYLDSFIGDHDYSVILAHSILSRDPEIVDYILSKNIADFNYALGTAVANGLNDTANEMIALGGIVNQDIITDAIFNSNYEFVEQFAPIVIAQGMWEHVAYLALERDHYNLRMFLVLNQIVSIVIPAAELQPGDYLEYVVSYGTYAEVLSVIESVLPERIWGTNAEEALLAAIEIRDLEKLRLLVDNLGAYESYNIIEDLEEDGQQVMIDIITRQ